ncbi:MAG: hypothetical protein RL660_1817 [Bacteroidota bacterium]|jgi:glycosyltransferase involved in cell wall biosynthesis
MQKPSLLIVLSRFPFPLEKGDKLRAYHQIIALSKHFDICLIAFSASDVKDEDLQEIHPYVTAMHILKYHKGNMVLKAIPKLLTTKLPLQVCLFASARMKLVVQKIADQFKPNLCYMQLARIAELKPSGFPAVLDYQDAFSENYKRSAATHKSFLWRKIFAIEAKRMAAYEQKVLSQFDVCTIISSADASVISDNIKVVANGVDTAFFSPRDQKRTYDIGFVGNLSYQPNVLATQYLVEKILPILPANTKVLLAGAEPSTSVSALASTQVEVQAWLPDIRDAYANCKIFVAPLFAGAGMQNKILEAMSMGIPCVTTSLVAKGLGAQNGVHLLTAETEAQFLDAILKLQNDGELCSKLTDNASQLVHRNFSWEANTESLVKVLMDVSDKASNQQASTLL